MSNIKLSVELKKLLLAGIATSQEELCAQLESQGFEVNQSKISRLLRKLNAVKLKNESGVIVYRLPKEPPPLSIAGRLAELIVEISMNEMVIVVSTAPGSANLIARLLDYNKEKCHLLGTIAGDDTIMLIPQSVKEIKNALQEVKALLHQK